VRKSWMDRFVNKDGSNDNFVIVATTIFDEGVDMPSVNVIVQGTGGKSEVKTIQRTGRGLRKKKGSGGLIVYDFLDSSKYLNEHSERRMTIYADVFGADAVNLVSEKAQERNTRDE